MSDLPATGTCRCGALGIEVNAPALMTAACHCRGCQKMSASAFSLTVMVPLDGFRISRGTPVRGGIHGPVCSHMFCKDCLSWVFTRIAGIDSFVNLRATMFDRPDWCEPFIETCCETRLHWVSTPAHHRFDGFPPEEQYLGLLAEYAAARSGS